MRSSNSTGRIELDTCPKEGQKIRITGEGLDGLTFREARPGELVTLTWRRGREFRGRILSINPCEAWVFVFESLAPPTESPTKIILLQALPDKERMELIIQKATELGVYSIVPFKSRRSITLEEREGKQPKAHRWQSIAIKAAKQSRRGRVPLIEPYCGFSEALAYAKGCDLKVILWEKGSKSTLRDILRSQGNYRKVALMVGPEGGFDPEEIQRARETGFISITLGRRIMRTETTAILLVGILQYELGDLGR
ncbi:MAG: 16S rRNA (uracil(1498)-N(3))-methyltransferase [Syntrophobacterales bacterium]|nr:MAG: 16S rRNA (uracil(1498)-N(3))-methyltransferase [Syntrophobacterales bacterium]